MSIFDCSVEIADFHEDEVRLPTDERKDMQKRRDAGRTRLRTGLERDGFKTPNTFSQGSYAMYTMVQDDDYDYDIDDGAYFWHEDLQDSDGKALDPKAAKQRVCNALKQDERLNEPASVHNNCVRQVYPEGYHIDIPVYRVVVADADEDDDEAYELASATEWTRSDARAVTKWFKKSVKDLNGDFEAGRQMRRVVRLSKSFARSRKEWKNSTCSGIVLTRLVVDEFVQSEDRDDIALRETWKRIENRLNKSCLVEHPVNAGNLAEKDDACVKFFLKKLTDALGTLKVLDDECTRSEARKAWDAVFNTSYFSKCPDPGKGEGSGGKAAFVATESKTDRRDDGGGRYG